jgi:hypothetical protein
MAALGYNISQNHTMVGVKGSENCAFGPQYSYNSNLGISALEAPVNTGSCGPGDWRPLAKAPVNDCYQNSYGCRRIMAD